MVRKDKGMEKDSTVERGPVVVVAAIDAVPECGMLKDAFWREVNAIFYGCNAQTAAWSHDEDLKEMEEEEILVLSCGDVRFHQLFSSTDDGVKNKSSAKGEIRS